MGPEEEAAKSAEKRAEPEPEGKVSVRSATPGFSDECSQSLKEYGIDGVYFVYAVQRDEEAVQSVE